MNVPGMALVAVDMLPPSLLAWFVMALVFRVWRTGNDSRRRASGWMFLSTWLLVSMAALVRPDLAKEHLLSLSFGLALLCGIVVVKVFEGRGDL